MPRRWGWRSQNLRAAGAGYRFHPLADLHRHEDARFAALHPRDVQALAANRAGLKIQIGLDDTGRADVINLMPK